MAGRKSINALGNLYITARAGNRKLAELFYVPEGVSGRWYRMT